jgi:hypothetical protein
MIILSICSHVISLTIFIDGPKKVCPGLEGAHPTSISLRVEILPASCLGLWDLNLLPPAKIMQIDENSYRNDMESKWRGESSRGKRNSPTSSWRGVPNWV